MIKIYKLCSSQLPKLIRSSGSYMLRGYGSMMGTATLLCSVETYFAEGFANLAASMAQQKLNLYRIRPKLHMFAELVSFHEARKIWYDQSTHIKLLE